MDYYDTITIDDIESPFTGIEASFPAAISPNTWRAYNGGWERWQGWAFDHGEQDMPACPRAISVYLFERAKAGLAPATVHMDRSSISAAHRAAGVDDPTADEAVRQTVRFIYGASRVRTPGQVAGVDWDGADRAAALAESDGSVIGLRDGALIRVGSDAMLRVSETAAIDVADVMEHPRGDGTVTVWRSKTDQVGRGQPRYLGPPTIEAVRRYRLTAGIPDDGALFRRINKAGAVGERLGVRSIRRIITRRAGAAGIGGRVSGHSLRVGSAQSLAAAGAGLVEMQQAGDWKSPQMPAHYARHLEAARGAVARLRYGVGTDGRPHAEQASTVRG